MGGACSRPVGPGCGSASRRPCGRKREAGGGRRGRDARAESSSRAAESRAVCAHGAPRGVSGPLPRPPGRPHGAVQRRLQGQCRSSGRTPGWPRGPGPRVSAGLSPKPGPRLPSSLWRPAPPPESGGPRAPLGRPALPRLPRPTSPAGAPRSGPFRPPPAPPGTAVRGARGPCSWLLRTQGSRPFPSVHQAGVPVRAPSLGGVGLSPSEPRCPAFWGTDGVRAPRPEAACLHRAWPRAASWAVQHPPGGPEAGVGLSSRGHVR